VEAPPPQCGFQVAGGGEAGGFRHLGNAAQALDHHPVDLQIIGLQMPGFDRAVPDRLPPPPAADGGFAHPQLYGQFGRRATGAGCRPVAWAWWWRWRAGECPSGFPA